MKKLIDAGCDVNLATKAGWTPLHFCSYKGFIEGMSLLLQVQTIDLDAMNDEGNTAVMLAVIENQSYAAKLLVSKGANINLKNADRLSPLFGAVMAGDNEMVEFLLASGANVSIDQNFQANRTTSIACVAVLMSKRSSYIDDIYSTVYEYVHGLIRISLVVSDRPDMLELLHHAGVDFIHTGCLAGFCPLHMAAVNGFDEVTTLLLSFLEQSLSYAQLRMAVNLRTVSGWTPLYAAATAGHDAIIRILLEYDLQWRTRRGGGGGGRGGEEEDPQSTIALDSADAKGATALMAAAATGSEASVRLLLDAGAALHSADLDGNNLFHYITSKPVSKGINQSIRLCLVFTGCV
jgi:ankyrin repeat protein